MTLKSLSSEAQLTLKELSDFLFNQLVETKQWPIIYGWLSQGIFVGISEEYLHKEYVQMDCYGTFSHLKITVSA